MFGRTKQVAPKLDGLFALPTAALTLQSELDLVTSGNAGAPSCVENLMPLYSGGLCDAVKLIAPEVFICRTA